MKTITTSKNLQVPRGATVIPRQKNKIRTAFYCFLWKKEIPYVIQNLSISMWIIWKHGFLEFRLQKSIRAQLLFFLELSFQKVSIVWNVSDWIKLSVWKLQKSWNSTTTNTKNGRFNNNPLLQQLLSAPLNPLTRPFASFFRSPSMHTLLLSSSHFTLFVSAPLTSAHFLATVTCRLGELLRGRRSIVILIMVRTL